MASFDTGHVRESFYVIPEWKLFENTCTATAITVNVVVAFEVLCSKNGMLLYFETKSSFIK